MFGKLLSFFGFLPVHCVVNIPQLRLLFTTYIFECYASVIIGKKKTSFITESCTQDEEYENLALVILPVFIKYETQLLAFYPLNGITFGIMNAKSLTKSTKPQTCK